MTELEQRGELELELQHELDEHVDAILNLLERAGAAGVELDPLRTILDRLKNGGVELDLDGMPPLVRMVLAGALGE